MSEVSVLFGGQWWQGTWQRLCEHFKDSCCVWCRTKTPAPTFCGPCQMTLKMGSHHPRYRLKTNHHPQEYFPVFSAVRQTVHLKDKLYPYKFYQARQYQLPLVALATTYWRQHLLSRFQAVNPKQVWVVPIPVRQEVHLDRGHLWPLARGFAQAFGYRLVDGLGWARDTHVQHQLSRRGDRQQNMLGALQVNKTWTAIDGKADAPQTIILFDDLVTTGATLKAAATAVHQALPSESTTHVMAYTLGMVPDSDALLSSPSQQKTAYSKEVQALPIRVG